MDMLQLQCREGVGRPHLYRRPPEMVRRCTGRVCPVSVRMHLPCCRSHTCRQQKPFGTLIEPLGTAEIQQDTTSKHQYAEQM